MNRSLQGRNGEDRAAASLEAAGLRILRRNYRSRTGEIDLIAQEGDTLVFVEVKAWNSFGSEDLERSINGAKQRRIIETAKFFLASHREYNSMALRFDVVLVGPGGVHHLEEAFMERV